jgi:hypothetical protein
MGYELHITRAENWWDSEASPIALADWRALVRDDPEFEETGVAEAATPEGTLRYENEGLSLWSAHPNGEQVWFDWRDGCVIVKNPDEPTIAKMVGVAELLGARVQGDEGETYPQPTDPSPEDPPEPTGEPLIGRIAGWLGRVSASLAEGGLTAEFAPGERVQDFRGQTGTVLEVDPQAEHGLGRIRVKFDDGRELSFALAAHGLTRAEEDPGAA